MDPERGGALPVDDEMSPGTFPISKRLLLINSASSLLTRVVNVTVLLWMFQYLLRRIPAEEFAVYPVVTSVMALAPLFFSLFTGGISRYIVEAHVRGEPEAVTRIASSIFPLLALAAAVLLAMGWSLAFNIQHVFNISDGMTGDAQLMMALMVASFASTMMAVPFLAAFDVRQRFVELNLWSIGRDLLRCLLLLILLIGLEAHVLWVVVATVIAEYAFLLAILVRGARLMPALRFRLRLFDRRQAMELMSFGMWTTLGQISTMLNAHSAIIVLNLFGTAVDVTVFHIGATLYRQFNSTIQLAIRPLQPVMTALHTLDDRESRQRLAAVTLRGGRYACWATLAIATPLAIYAPEFVRLYVGDAYAAAVWTIVLLMAVYPAAMPTTLLAMTAIARARVRPFYLPAFLIMIVALVLMVATAMAGFGAPGVALAQMAAVVAGQLFYFWPLQLRLTGNSFAEFARQVLLRGMAPALAGSLAWVTLKFAFPVTTWPGLILCSAAGGLVYLAVLAGLCLTPADKDDLRTMLQRLRGG